MVAPELALNVAEAKTSVNDPLAVIVTSTVELLVPVVCDAAGDAAALSKPLVVISPGKVVAVRLGVIVVSR